MTRPLLLYSTLTSFLFFFKTKFNLISSYFVKKVAFEVRLNYNIIAHRIHIGGGFNLFF
jgi:hypothetical protein